MCVCVCCSCCSCDASVLSACLSVSSSSVFSKAMEQDGVLFLREVFVVRGSKKKPATRYARHIDIMVSAHVQSVTTTNSRGAWKGSSRPRIRRYVDRCGVICCGASPPVYVRAWVCVFVRLFCCCSRFEEEINNDGYGTQLTVGITIIIPATCHINTYTCSCADRYSSRKIYLAGG